MKAINKVSKRIAKLSFALLSLIACPTLTTAEDAAWQVEFMKEHCVKCHGPDNSEGEVRLDDVSQAAFGLATAERWESVFSVLQSGEMPPADEPTIKAEDLEKMIAGVKEILRQRLPTDAPFPRTAIRRMNRFQYNNSVVDLLELKVDLFVLPDPPPADVPP
jgi:mono/diheme cytochrome c family protein